MRTSLSFRAASGSLLPVLVVLSLARGAAPFVPLRALELQPINYQSCQKLITSRTQTNHLRATLDKYSSVSSFMDEHDDEDEEDDLEDENVILIPLDNDEVVNGLPEMGPPSPFGGHRRPRKAKSRNPAMRDPVFLRKRTEKILNDLHDNHAISSRGMKVDRKTFHFLIDAWAFSGEIDAAEQAVALLHKMEAMALEDPLQLPDVRSYTKVINAMARSNSPHAGEWATDIFDKMNYLHRSGMNPTVKPNTFTYTAVVEAWANSGVPGAAQHAEEFCEIMVQKFFAGDDPDVWPTARAFNAVINAYAKSGELGAAQRADELFRRMEGVHLSTGLEEVRPNRYNYNSLISAWANCGEEAAVEDVLARMEAAYLAGDLAVRPTTVTYNSVIDCYSKRAGLSEDPFAPDEAGEKAEGVLRHMEQLYKSGENVDAKPNVRSYNTVINVWAKSQSELGAKRAEEILDLMERMVEAGDDSVRPDVHSFSTVINAWARSHKENKAERALNILKEMKQLYAERGDENLRPNVVVANAVMNACAYTTGDYPERNRALEIAHKVLKSLESGEYGRPDQITYGTFLKVCANQMPECSTREQIAEMIFRKCVRDGQVGNLVLQQLKATITPPKYLELVGMDICDGHVMEDLPPAWWCNVVEGKWRRRRNF